LWGEGADIWGELTLVSATPVIRFPGKYADYTTQLNNVSYCVLVW